jgi:hypothetical protein
VALQDAMSRQEAEVEVAGRFVEAAKTYAEYPIALQLRV